ncbi:MAG: leucyl aminopeptidase [Cardiobacteriaceae bacterium]|nr:leucyl aminopeptidase [Cardiobacteriaceae bacterium]
MKFSLKVCAPAAVAADVVAVSLGCDGTFSPILKALDDATNGFFSAQAEKGNLPTKEGAVRLFVDVPQIATSRVLVIRHNGSDNALEAASARVQQLADESGWSKVALLLAEGTSVVSVVARATAAAAYRFDTFKSDAAKAKKYEWLFVCDKEEKKAVQATLDLAYAWAQGSYLTRDLVNTPPNVCTPAWLGEQAEAMAKDYADLSVKVLKKKEIVALGMGALLGVAQGSVNEPRFIIFEYKPAKAQNQQPQVLVGKGVTFDTGGISIKPAAGMDEMKGDMGGAAAVFGAMKALCEAELPLYVVGLVASVENMPDGNAIRPGDILTTMSGKTVEVLNTDAEGRLILCDALTYAVRYQPQAVIDMATLTGAIVIALGSVRSGLFSNDDALAQALLLAGENARDIAWRMPLDQAYRDMLRSPFADLPNISGVREAGAVTAAAYLSAFVEYPWAHLDIAGTAFKKGGGADKGGTGRPVGLLLEYFRAQVA